TDEKNRAIVAWKNKTDQAKKGEVLREIQKLKVHFLEDLLFVSFCLYLKKW
ncbi:hypothetical protein CHS0354_027585, partial [Potamilus streckersoni]